MNFLLKQYSILNYNYYIADKRNAQFCQLTQNHLFLIRAEVLDRQYNSPPQIAGKLFLIFQLERVKTSVQLGHKLMSQIFADSAQD